jgi:arsenate reductase (thioredoxin)
MNHKPRILFFSTGDSTRSQMAEAFTRFFSSNQVVAVSTAVHSAESDPIVGEVMNEVGIDISTQHSKEIADVFKEHFSYVVTVCDASTERFPVWPFSRNIIHWSHIDPERVNDSVHQKREVFRKVRDEICCNVKELLAQILPP